MTKSRIEIITEKAQGDAEKIIQLQESIKSVTEKVFEHMEPLINAYIENFDTQDHPSHAELFMEFEKIKSIRVRNYIYGKIIDSAVKFPNTIGSDKLSKLITLKETMKLYVTPMEKGAIY